MLNTIINYIKRNATIPNLLTLVRIILIPVYWHYFIHYPDALMTRFGIFFVASITDALDGYLARRLNQVSDFGKLFDPLADKLMVTSILISQYMAGIFPLLPILIILGKDLLLIIGSTFLLKKNFVADANIWGKVSTASFILSLALSFFYQHFPIRCDIILLWGSVGLSLIAFISYLIRAVKFLKKSS